MTAFEGTAKGNRFPLGLIIHEKMKYIGDEVRLHVFLISHHCTPGNWPQCPSVKRFGGPKSLPGVCGEWRIELRLLGCSIHWPSKYADWKKGVKENMRVFNTMKKEEMTEWRKLHKHELHN
jgi:hypothetical protein